MSEPVSKKGKIITFYSYKGGVGRSMALANISVVLAQWGYKVLIIDWDLEAPGLENFFKEYLSIKRTNERPGVIDLLVGESADSNTDKKVHWKDCIVPVNIDSARAKVDLITAGLIDDKYYERVRSFDFGRFYTENDGGKIIETLRNEWATNYDFVLIDSRTGVTDIGGVCTIQLPDILVILFTPTEQSLQGVKRVALKAMAAQRKLPYDRINLLALPVPTRIDNTEFELTKEWFGIFEAELKEIYQKWIPENYSIDLKEFLLSSKVPYISYFSFGEALPVVKASLTDPTGMSYAYVSIAALLANKLDFAHLLLTERSKLIKNAFTADQEGYATWEKQMRKQVLSTIFYNNIKRYLTSKVSIAVVWVILAAAVLISFFVTRQISGKNQARFQLKADSIVNANKLLIDSLRDRDSAKTVIIKKYFDPGKNALTTAQQELLDTADRNVNIKKYNIFSNLRFYDAWNASFVSWCFNHEIRYFRPIGNGPSLERYLSVDTQFYFRYGKNFFPQPGDIYFYDWKGTRSTGIVESYSPERKILTGIEGNSNENENKPGYKVARVTFKENELIRYNFAIARVQGL